MVSENEFDGISRRRTILLKRMKLTGIEILQSNFLSHTAVKSVNDPSLTIFVKLIKRMGESFSIILRATAMLYGASAPDKTLGCIEFTFKLDTC